jgi:hypothetical protein
MSAPHQIETQGSGSASRLALWLLGGGFGLLLAAGLLLWWREGDRLFTDGLIAALLACF